MNLDRLALGTLFVLALAGCAHDASQEPRSAAAERASSSVQDVAGGDRVPQQPPSADVRAELEAAQQKDARSADVTGPTGALPTAPATAPAESNGDEAGAAPAAPVAAAAAPAPVESSDAERRDYEAKTKERVARIDTRAKELLQRGAKLTATKRTSFETSFRRFTAERNDAGAKVDALGGRSGAAWKTAKGSVERSLDDLESTLARLDDQR